MWILIVNCFLHVRSVLLTEKTGDRFDYYANSAYYHLDYMSDYKSGYHAGNCPQYGCVDPVTESPTTAAPTASTGESPCPSSQCWTYVQSFMSNLQVFHAVQLVSRYPSSRPCSIYTMVKVQPHLLGDSLQLGMEGSGFSTLLSAKAECHTTWTFRTMRKY